MVHTSNVEKVYHKVIVNYLDLFQISKDVHSNENVKEDLIQDEKIIDSIIKEEIHMNEVTIQLKDIMTIINTITEKEEDQNEVINQII